MCQDVAHRKHPVRLLHPAHTGAELISYTGDLACREVLLL